MVDHPLEISFAELLTMPLTEADITLVCVSNEVGGTLQRERPVARRAAGRAAAPGRGAGGRGPGAVHLHRRDDDLHAGRQRSWTAANALLAVGMNGQPLPIAHGFPARMVVPGLYGYVSATKWVTRLTLTTFANAAGVLDPARLLGPGADQDRVAHRRAQAAAQVPAGRVAVAGVAWAPATAASRPSRSAWTTARGSTPRLAAADGIDTWRQWMWAWDATPGLHTLRVRATDGTGATQTVAARPPCSPTARAAGTPPW